MRCIAAVLLTFGLVTLGSAQGPTPMGVEFQVNTYTSWYQWYSTVAYGPQGEFVVVWQDGTDSVAGDDGSRIGIKGQRLDSAGARAGAEFQVNTYTPDSQLRPQVDIGPGGDFVVVWDSQAGPVGQDQEFRSARGQRFNAAGAPTGGEFQANTTETGDQYYPDVAVGPGSNFAVVWSGIGPGPDPYGSVVAQAFDDQGSRQGEEFQVNTITTYKEFQPRVALHPAGKLVVSWTSYGSFGDDDSRYSVQAREYEFPPGLIFADGFESGDMAAGRLRCPEARITNLVSFADTWESASVVA